MLSKKCLFVLLLCILLMFLIITFSFFVDLRLLWVVLSEMLIGSVYKDYIFLILICVISTII